MGMHVMVAGEHRKKSLPDAIGAVKLHGSLNTIERVAALRLGRSEARDLCCTNELV